MTCIAFNAIISVSVDLKERFSAPDLASNMRAIPSPLPVKTRKQLDRLTAKCALNKHDSCGVLYDSYVLKYFPSHARNVNLGNYLYLSQKKNKLDGWTSKMSIFLFLSYFSKIRYPKIIINSFVLIIAIQLFAINQLFPSLTYSCLVLSRTTHFRMGMVYQDHAIPAHAEENKWIINWRWMWSGVNLSVF